jgi:hypothetical protein
MEKMGLWGQINGGVGVAKEMEEETIIIGQMGTLYQM